MTAISNRNDKYIAPSFVENKKQKNKINTDTCKFTNRKGPNLYFMAMQRPWMLPLFL